jgi:NAD(P)H dehydrogenase (quinone)
MRVHVIFAHPEKDSLCGSILSTVLEELAQAGHDVDVLDLYAENFDPVLSLEEWKMYEGPAGSAIRVYVDRLKRSNGIIWIFPTWNYGLPAILKGYVDRVWKPNVAFRIDDRRGVHFDQFENLDFFIVATTFGASWLINTLCRNPCKQMVSNGLKRHFAHRSTFVWLALYNMDRASPAKLKRFLARVRTKARACATPRSS